MDPRSSKRSYNGPALEFWFGRLCQPWEHFFNEEELQQGRKIYRKGEIRELELSHQDAIVQARRETGDYYAVLEWKGESLDIRASTEDKAACRALAAAGLYEIEELISEEITPTPPDELTPTSARENPAAALAETVTPLQVELPVNARFPLLHFRLLNNSLRFYAYWETTHGKRIPALGKDADEANKLEVSERETLIRLASLARRQGFRFRNDAGCYILEELEQAPAFVRKELNAWRRYFRLDIDPEVSLLERGIQEADIYVQAEEEEGEGFRIGWDFRIGKEALNAGERRRLTHRGISSTMLLPGRGLVRVGGKSASLLQDWKETLGETASRKLPRYMLFSLFSSDSCHLKLTPVLSEWRNSLFRPSTNGQTLPALLRPYQQQGVRWMHHLAHHGCHCLLADEMGLGKTLQVLSLIVTYKVKDKPTLIVCPASVVPVWIGEMAKHFPFLDAEVVQKGIPFERSGNPPDVWVCSYTQLRRHKSRLNSLAFGYAILDEAQFIKNPEAKVTQACLNIQADHRIALTGTPLENRFLDIWTLFRFLMPGLLGARKPFETRLQEEPEVSMQYIRRQIAPFVLRRTKADVIKELPDKVESDLTCPLSDLQRAEYSRLAEQGIVRLGENLDTVAREHSLSLFTLLTRLRQVCCDPGLLPWLHPGIEHSGKLSVLLDRLPEIIANGHKVVIFSQFVRLLERLKQGLAETMPDVPLHMLTGKTLDRAEPVKAFQERQGAGIMLVSLRAGGTGITLHAADYVFLLDPWWNPAVEEQAIDRVHRIGQKKTVFVYRMVTSGTLEEKIQLLKQDKRQLFAGTFGRNLNTIDFKDYFASLSQLISLLPEGHSSSPKVNKAPSHALTSAAT